MGITELLRNSVAPLAVAYSLALGSCTYHPPKTPGEIISRQLQEAKAPGPGEVLILYDRWPDGAPGPSERPKAPTLEVLSEELEEAKGKRNYEQANSIRDAIILANICNNRLIHYRIGGLTMRGESGALQMEPGITAGHRSYNRLAPAEVIVYCLSNVNIPRVLDVANTYKSIQKVRPPIFKFDSNKNQKLERVLE